MRGRVRRGGGRVVGSQRSYRLAGELSTRGPRRHLLGRPSHAAEAEVAPGPGPGPEGTCLRVRPGKSIRISDLDPDGVKVIRRLDRHGYVAYLVGGCVRDLLLGVPPKDFDIVTDARPRQVKRLFRNSRIIGRRFRLVHVTFQGKVLDVSTFRAAADAPHDSADLLIRQDNVFGDPATDARRRDFTINGLFYDIHRQEVLDHVGGLRDLERRTLETIGDPWVRFREDPIRMFRAIKFAARLQFRLADDVYQAIIDGGPEIRKAAPPRLLEELVRLMNRGSARESMRLLYKTGLMALILPEVASALDADDLRKEPGWLWSTLRAADHLVTNGESLSNVTLLACLFGYLIAEDLPSSQEQAPGREASPQLVEQVIKPIAQRLLVSRRDTYRLEQVLTVQDRFRTRTTPRRRRRNLPEGKFVAREYFRDAFAFFRIRAAASDCPEDAETVRRWYDFLRHR